ncbi:MAG: hypothetical protein J5720_01725 [Bacteroidaceae bacterium]|nr:hypothetical protein [Bacteroidaceae bacterium]
MKRTILSAFAAAIAVAFSCAFVACSNDKDEEVINDNTPKNEVFKPVLIPDFVFASNENVLYSTFGTRADRVDVPKYVYEDYYKTKIDEVEINLSVADDLEPINKQGWSTGEYKASKLSIHVRYATDVTVFLPVESAYFCYNNANSLAVIETHDKNPAEPTADEEAAKDKVVGIYGKSQATYSVNGQTVTAQVTFGKTQKGVNGIQIEVKGMTKEAVDYLYTKYGDGLTIEVWNYYVTIPRKNLIENFNKGANVYFSSRPKIYVNAFAKVNDFEGKVFSEEEMVGGAKVFTPYYVKDNVKTPLAQEYWVRPVLEDGSPSNYYILKGKKCASDCTVAPSQYNSFPYIHTNNADVPDDIETVYSRVDDNYNVYYFKYNPVTE